MSRFSSTRSLRAILLTPSNRFWSAVETVDPDQIWCDLCESGNKKKLAIHLCQKFLRAYATRRKRERVVLGPNEKEAKLVVHSARTVVNVWRTLVTHFNRTVLRRRRREDPDNTVKWNLSFKEGLFSQKGMGPQYEVVRVYLPAPRYPF